MIDKKLTTKHRNALAASSFALPELRKLPIPDISHARNALARASMMLNEHSITQAQYDAALRRIYARYPALKTHDSVWFDAKPSNFGWSVGDTVAYTYRYYNGGSHGYAYGVVKAVHPGSTKNTAKVTIEPYPAWRFGEGEISRKIAIVHHATKPAGADGKPGSKG